MRTSVVSARAKFKAGRARDAKRNLWGARLVTAPTPTNVSFWAWNETAVSPTFQVLKKVRFLWFTSSSLVHFRSRRSTLPIVALELDIRQEEVEVPSHVCSSRALLSMTSVEVSSVPASMFYSGRHRCTCVQVLAVWSARHQPDVAPARKSARCVANPTPYTSYPSSNQ